MTDLQLAAKELLEQCDKTANLPPSHPQRVADMIIQHGQLRAMLRDHISYQRGFRAVLLALISLVYELLGTVSAASNGQADWQTELPKGTAPAFRRALNKLLDFVRRHGEQDA